MPTETCRKCGTSIPPDQTLCDDCGNTCEVCRTSIPPGDTLCDECECPICHSSKPPDDRLCPDCQDLENDAVGDDDELHDEAWDEVYAESD